MGGRDSTRFLEEFIKPPEELAIQLRGLFRTRDDWASHPHRFNAGHGRAYERRREEQLERSIVVWDDCVEVLQDLGVRRDVEATRTRSRPATSAFIVEILSFMVHSSYEAEAIPRITFPVFLPEATYSYASRTESKSYPRSMTGRKLPSSMRSLI